MIFYREVIKTSVTTSMARVGEHAVQRLFQRADNQSYADRKFDFSVYARNVKTAIAWSEALYVVAGAMQKMYKSAALSIFAPTSAGAFLGQISSDGLWVDLRTFVSLDKMFESQKKLWRLLRSVEEEVGLNDLGLALTVHKLTPHSRFMKTILRLTEIMNAHKDVVLR